MSDKSKIILLAALFGFFLIFPLSIDAQGLTFLEEKVGLLEFLRDLHSFALAVGGVLAVGMIVVGAIYISASGAIDKQSEGRDMITSAILGLILLFSSTLILRTLNPELAVLTAPHRPEITMPVADQAIIAELCKSANFQTSSYQGESCSETVRQVSGHSLLLNDGSWISLTGEIKVDLFYNTDHGTVTCDVTSYRPEGGQWRSDNNIRIGFSRQNRCSP